MMQRDFLGREKRMWVAGVPFFIKKSENPQGKDLEHFLRSTVFLCESRSEILIYSSRNNSTHDLSRSLAKTSTRRRRSESRLIMVSELPTFLTRSVVKQKLQQNTTT